MTFASLVDSKLSRHILFVVLIGVLFFWSHNILTARADYEVSSGTVQALYHFSTSAASGSYEMFSDSSGNGYSLYSSTSSSPSLVTSFATYLGDMWNGSSSNTAYWNTLGNNPDLTGWTGFSAGAWMKGTQSYMDIFGLGYRIALVSYHGAEHCEINDSHEFIGTKALDDGAKHFFVCAWDGSIVSLYVDGTLDTTSSYSGSPTNGANHIMHLDAPGDGSTAADDQDETFLIKDTALNATQVTTLWNGGDGAEICVTAGCGDSSTSTPYIATSTQYKSDRTTVISEGSSTTDSTVVFAATLESSSTHALALQVEAATSTSFTGIPNVPTSTVLSGVVASTTKNDFAPGTYYWQARVVDTTTQASSSWQQFGTAGVVDFTVPAPSSTNFEISDGSAWALYHLNSCSSATTVWAM